MDEQYVGREESGDVAMPAGRMVAIGSLLAALLFIVGCEGTGVVVQQPEGEDAAGTQDSGPPARDTDDSGSGGVDDAYGGSDAEGGGGDASGNADTGGDVDEGCPQGGEMCGAGCCTSGEECVEGQCLPACGGTRCGADKKLCCTGKDLCLGEKCVTPGKSCQRTEDCKVDEICDPTVGRCLPRDSVEVCQYKPPVGKFSPTRDCHWSPASDDPYSGRGEIEAAPVVANVTDDNGDGKTDTSDIPDIITLSDDHDKYGCCNNPSTIRIISGKCNADGSMNTLGSISTPSTESSGGIAVGDLTGNGVPEIVAVTRISGRERGTAAWTRTKADGSKWKKLWWNKTYPTRSHTRGGAVISLADLEADGKPDVIIGNVALNGQNGKLKWDGRKTSNGKGGVGNNAFLGPSSAVADIDLDGKREVAAGNTLYNHDGSVEWTYKYTSKNSGCQGSLPCDGFTAFADFDGDPEGEVVIVRLGEVFILNHDGTLFWKAKILKDNCGKNESGPPTVADFDGDGKPEIGTAAADFYTVLDPECDASPVPKKCRQRGVLWATPNQDCSSRVTASSVFDFEGDGRAEMVYADEKNFYIFDGVTGKILHRDTDHRSNTRIEMPVVVDVDNDGNSEVIVPAPYGPNKGISVWADKDDNWVRTRRIWNQHAYSVTNVTEAGQLPTKPRPNWQNGRLNNFRQNMQPGGLFDAPDLAVSQLKVSEADCLQAPSVDVEITVKNEGALGVAPGVAVHLVVLHDGKESVAAAKQTTQRLLPGQTQTFQVSWDIPKGHLKDGFELEARVDPDKQINECHEKNNSRSYASSKIEVSQPDLEVKNLSVADMMCGQTGKIAIQFDAVNTGSEKVPKGVLLRLEAVQNGQTFTIADRKTSAALAPGQTRKVQMDWKVASQLVNRSFEVRVTVDPERTVFSCKQTNQASKEAVCRIGG